MALISPVPTAIAAEMYEILTCILKFIAIKSEKLIDLSMTR